MEEGQLHSKHMRGEREKKKERKRKKEREDSRLRTLSSLAKTGSAARGYRSVKRPHETTLTAGYRRTERVSCSKRYKRVNQELIFMNTNGKVVHLMDGL